LVAARCVCGKRIPLRTADDLPEGASRLGKYILLRRIAVGGMGEIYYGKMAGVEGFEREVAIKKMLPHLSVDRGFIDMMIKEAKLTVLLNHPNIVQVFDLAKEGNEYYIAMEFVPGINVGNLLEFCHRAQVRLPVEAAVHITIQVLAGLAYAHALRDPDGTPMNLLHRDITPQNIMVTKNAWVKITDFGIAKARNEISTTSPGMIKGKLGYIAPEQIHGQAPDQRVDLFCAGILLWESLATRRLFKGADEVDTFRLLSEAKVPLLRSIRDDVAPELDHVVQQSLAQDRNNRYRNAELFSSALSAAMLPRSNEDLAAVTRKFFVEHAEFFESATGFDTKLGTQPTETLSTADLRSLVDIRTLTIVKKSAFPFRAVAMTTMALVALAAGGAALWMRQQSRFGHVEKTDTPPVTNKDPGPSPEPNKKGEPRKERPPVGPSRTKGPLTGPEIQGAVQHQSESIARCLQKLDAAKAPPVVNAKMIIETDGSVSEVTFDPAVGDGNVEHCLDRTLKAMHFRHPPAPTPVTIPLKIQVL